MGNKLSGSPLPAYEAAATSYSSAELAELKSKFFIICNNQESITMANFAKRNAAASPYSQRLIYPRIFAVFDTKKDGVLDFEEYLCAVTVFRSGSPEDKIKCIYMMYEGGKGGSSIPKDNFRQLVVDASLGSLKIDTNTSTLDQWLTDMKPLSQAMAEAAFLQYATHASKIEIQELIAFSKSDTSTAALTTIITASLEC